MRPRLPRRRTALVLLAALALLAVAAGIVVGAGGEEQEAAEVPTPRRAAPEEQISFLARIVPPPPEQPAEGPEVPRTVADLARRLPLERKVAQLLLVGFRGTDASAEIFGRLRRLDLGGVVLGSHNYVDAATLAALTNELAAVARRRRHVPPWIFTTQEGGELNSFADLPPAAVPAEVGSAGAAATAARDSARALRELGVVGVLGPVVDVGLEAGSALGVRLYSDDPAEVAAYAERTVRAYRRERVFSAVGHFPGLGAADQSTQEGPASVGLGVEELAERDLVPFEAAVRAGVPGVVLSHALYPFSDFTVPASLSSQAATELLRGRLGFEGVAITDDLADPAITVIHTVPGAAVRAVRAGVDMVHISGTAGDQQAAYVALLRAVRRGGISRQRLNEAVARVLFAKRDLRLIR